jgi:hypothetical protein
MLLTRDCCEILHLPSVFVHLDADRFNSPRARGRRKTRRYERPSRRLQTDLAIKMKHTCSDDDGGRREDVHAREETLVRHTDRACFKCQALLIVARQQDDRGPSLTRLSFFVYRAAVHPILTMPTRYGPLRRANWMALTPVRVWSGHSRVTPGAFPRVSSSYDMRLRSRIIDSVRAETRARPAKRVVTRYPLPVYIYPQANVRAWN